MPKDTRSAIITAAMRGFAENGFAATGIREIAAAAGTNVASISYHFGGKEGLRAACAERVVELMAGAVAPAGAETALPDDAAEARAMLERVVRGMARFLLVEPQARQVAGFVLREMAENSETIDRIYEGLFERVHRWVCAVWSVATGRPAESDGVRLTVFSLVGQIVYFHVARPVVLRRMGWPEIGPAEAEAVADAVAANLAARIAADREART